MGGTFDPIHFGHLIAAERAMEDARLNEVWFVPSHTPPHKQKTTGPNAEHRLAMVELAVEGNPCFRAMDDELKRGGTSYTYDTLESFRQTYAGYRFHFIIGADMVQILPQWHRIENIVRHFRFIGLQRPGYELDLAKLPPDIRAAVSLVPMPEIGISSTDIRTRASSGQSIRYLLPDSVYHYIKENQLYETMVPK